MRYWRAVLAGSGILVGLSVWAITRPDPPPLPKFVDDLRSLKSFREVHRGADGDWRYHWVYSVHTSEFKRASSLAGGAVSTRDGKWISHQVEEDGSVRSESWGNSKLTISLTPDPRIFCGTCAPPWRIRSDEVEVKISGDRRPTPWEQLLLKLELIPPPP